MRRRRVNSSRLSRTSEKQNKKQTLRFTVAIIVLIIILLQFGPILVNIFGNVVYTLRGADNENRQLVGKRILEPPILNDIPSATQSSRIIFSGIAADKNGFIELYVNDELEDEIEIADSTKFSADASLKGGKNVIKARFRKESQTSSFSSEFIVNYVKDKPKLDVTFPIDNSKFTRADKSITVTGETDSENSVSVNGFRAIVDFSGKFSYQLQLNDGDNTITIDASNPAGGVSQKVIKVNYSP